MGTKISIHVVCFDLFVPSCLATWHLAYFPLKNGPHVEL